MNKAQTLSFWQELASDYLKTLAVHSPLAVKIMDAQCGQALRELAEALPEDAQPRANGHDVERTTAV